MCVLHGLCPAFPTDARSDWDLGNLEPMWTHVPQAIPKSVKETSTWMPRLKVTQQNIAQHHIVSACLPSSPCILVPGAPSHPQDVNEHVIHQIKPPSSTGPWSSFDSYVPTGAHRGQHGHSDRSAAIQNCLYWCLSFLARMNFLSNLCYSSSSVGTDQMGKCKCNSVRSVLFIDRKIGHCSSWTQNDHLLNKDKEKDSSCRSYRNHGNHIGISDIFF